MLTLCLWEMSSGCSWYTVTPEILIWKIAESGDNRLHSMICRRSGSLFSAVPYQRRTLYKNGTDLPARPALNILADNTGFPSNNAQLVSHSNNRN